MLIVGSKALEHHRLHLSRPVQKGEVDVFATKEEKESLLLKAEGFVLKPYGMFPIIGGEIYDISDMDTSEELLHILGCTEGVHYASPDVVYTLKMSHRFSRNLSVFEKTRNDILWMRNVLGCRIPPYLEEWYERRVEETYRHQLPKLNQSKKDFFDTPGVTYRYDHDTLHEAINPSPTYRKFLKDGEEVMVDKAKWDALSFEDKLSSVVEEASVLALERCLVPFGWKKSEEWAYKMALQKVCTSISSGWWRDFAWEHYDVALNRKPDLTLCFARGIASGTIKEHCKGE